MSRFLGTTALLILGLVLGSVALRSHPVAAQQTGFGTVAVQKVLVDLNNNPVFGQDLSGFVFTLTPASGGGTVALPPTNAAGQTSFLFPPDNYIMNEQPRLNSNTTFVGFSLASGVGLGSVPVTAGQTISVIATNRVQGTGQITITKLIVDANNNLVANADRSGFTFAIAGPNGFNQAVTTGTNGTVTLPNLATPAGATYAVIEAPRTGFTITAMSVDGIGVATNGQAFTLTPGQTRQVLVNNRPGTTTGTVTITKQVVDASGAQVAGANRGGFTFTVTCPGPFTAQGITDASGLASVPNVPAGSCTVNESLSLGFTLVSIVAGAATNVIANNGTFVVTAGLTTNLLVRNTQAQAPTEQERLLGARCNFVTLTWPQGTSVTTVAAAIAPATALEAIWRFDVVQNRFLGFSPNPNAPNDYLITSRLEPVFICVRVDALLNRPRV